MPKRVTLDLPEDSYNAFFMAASALYAMAGDDAPTPEQLMCMAINPDAAASLYEAFIPKAPEQDLPGL